MRISLIEPKENESLSSRASIFLDGVAVERCVCADDVEGIVVVYDPNFSIFTPSCPPWRPFPKTTRHGKVQILFDVEEFPNGWYGRSTPKTQYPDVYIPRTRTEAELAAEELAWSKCLSGVLE